MTDELKLATSISKEKLSELVLKIEALLPAGHFALGFWYSKTGAFISSTYYGENYQIGQPNSIRKKLFEIFKQELGITEKETYNESLNDNNPYEGKLYKNAIHALQFARYV